MLQIMILLWGCITISIAVWTWLAVGSVMRQLMRIERMSGIIMLNLQLDPAKISQPEKEQ